MAHNAFHHPSNDVAAHIDRGRIAQAQNAPMPLPLSQKPKLPAPTQQPPPPPQPPADVQLLAPPPTLPATPDASETETGNKLVDDEMELDEDFHDPPEAIKSESSGAAAAAATTDEIDESANNEELDISLTSQQRYAARRQIEHTLNRRIPNSYMFADDRGVLYHQGKPITNSNLDAILNFLTTPRAQYVAGATALFRALLKVPGFDTNLVTNPIAFQKYSDTYKAMPRPFEPGELKGGIGSGGGGGGQRKKRFIVITKLPSDLA